MCTIHNMYTDQLNSLMIVTAEKYAEMVGLPIGVVRGQLDRRQLPVYKVGKRRFINLIQLRLDVANGSS